MSLANRLVSFVSQHTVDGPDAGPPRVLLESSSHQTIIALAATGYGLAIVPSAAQILARGMCAIPLVHREAPIGGWSMVAWDPQRFLAPYAQKFVDELAAYSQRTIRIATHAARPSISKIGKVKRQGVERHRGSLVTPQFPAKPTR